MLGLLDKKKNMGALIVASMRKPEEGKKPAFQREMDGSVTESEEEVSLKDQMLACATRMFKAIKSSDEELFVKAAFQLHEAIDQAIEEGIDIDEDAGKDERGEMLSDDSVGEAE